MSSQLRSISVVAFLCFSGSAFAAGEFAEADFRATYSDSGSLDGEAIGHVSAYRIIMERGPPESVHIEDAMVRYLEIETRYNHTNVPYGPGVIDPVDFQQTVTWTNLSADDLLLEWPLRDRDTLMLVHDSGFMTWDHEPIELEVETLGASWSGPQRGGFGIPFYWPMEDKPAFVWGGLGEWHRSVRFDHAPPVEIDSAFVLQLRQTSITADGQPIAELPPYETKQPMLLTPVPGAGRTQTILTEGFLYVDVGTMMLDVSGVPVLVSGFDWNVTGDTVWNGATGTYRIGDQQGTFSQESVGASGQYRVRDAVVAPEDEEGDPFGEMSASGSFAVIAVDYVVAAVGPVGPSLIEQAIWVTILFGLLGFVAWASQHTWVFLYSRIKEDAVLEHPKRADIMQFVEQNPGCHVLRLAEDLGMARGVARHHLMVLERAGRLRRFREAGQTLLAPAYQSKDDALRAAASDDPHLRTIRSIVAEGGVRRAELVAKLRDRHGVADPTARRWIDKAVRAGLIEESGKGHGVVYRYAS